MELIGFVAVLVMMLLLGIGVGIGLFVCLVAAILVGLGVLSSSVALGFLTKRPANALRALLLQCGLIAGIPAGAVTAWATHSIYHSIAAWQGWSMAGGEWKIPLFGAVGGAFAGVFLALLLDFILRRSHVWVEQRVKRKALPS